MKVIVVESETQILNTFCLSALHLPYLCPYKNCVLDLVLILKYISCDLFVQQKIGSKMSQ